MASEVAKLQREIVKKPSKREEKERLALPAGKVDHGLFILQPSRTPLMFSI
jgi:hypothetical protein